MKRQYVTTTGILGAYIFLGALVGVVYLASQTRTQR